MMVVIVALLIALGVLFGTQALVVDLGFDMSQHGSMQTAADAGALASARVLAASVGSTSPVNYVVSDNAVQAAAEQFGSYNQLVPTPAPTPSPSLTPTPIPTPHLTATYQTAVEYFHWNGTTCTQTNPRLFTAASNIDLVTEQGGTRISSALANQLGSVPTDTCGVRVFARITHGALLAQANGYAVERATASATARVYPANPPTTFTNVWPITRWLGAPGCTFSINSAPCGFWDSQGPPNGSFKLIVDMSRYSALVYPNPLRLQHTLDWDHIHPGNSGNRQNDLNDWLSTGWQGQLYVGDPRCSVNDVSILQFSGCSNSRLETYNGTLGNNVGGAMRSFIDAHAEGVDTSGQNLGNYVTMHVFLWRFGERSINSATDVASVLWTSGSSSQVQRVIVDQVRCFRFYSQTVTNSEARGYYVSCLSPDPPINGAPSTVANTVALID
jgi:hypothetical protein